MGRISLIIAFILQSTALYSQSKFINTDKFDDRQHFLITGSVNRFINKPDVETEYGNKHFLTAHNTTGYQIGIAYEYTNKRNISFGVGTSYGVQYDNLVWDYDFTGFDDRVDLSGYKIRYQFANRVPYLNMHVSVGYDYCLNAKKNTRLQAKVGVGQIHYFNHKVEYWKQILLYSRTSNDTVYNYGTQYALNYAFSGSDVKWYSQHNRYYSIYFGVCYKLNTLLFRECRLGARFTHMYTFAPGSDRFYYSNAVYYKYANGELVPDGIQKYKQKFRTLSIECSFGL